MISKVIREINQFKEEHKIFKGQFIFKNVDYREFLLQEANNILQFMSDRGLKNVPILKENGLLIQRDDDFARTDFGNYKKTNEAVDEKVNINKQVAKNKIQEVEESKE